MSEKTERKSQATMWTLTIVAVLAFYILNSPWILILLVKLGIGGHPVVGRLWQLYSWPVMQLIKWHAFADVFDVYVQWCGHLAHMNLSLASRDSAERW